MILLDSWETTATWTKGIHLPWHPPTLQEDKNRFSVPIEGRCQIAVQCDAAICANFIAVYAATSCFIQ